MIGLKRIGLDAQALARFMQLNSAQALTAHSKAPSVDGSSGVCLHLVAQLPLVSTTFGGVR